MDLLKLDRREIYFRLAADCRRQLADTPHKIAVSSEGKAGTDRVSVFARVSGPSELTVHVIDDLYRGHRVDTVIDGVRYRFEGG